VRAYHDAWTRGDLDTVRGLLGTGLTVESTLRSLPDGPDSAALLRFLGQFAGAITEVNLLSELYQGDRAALLYDCVTRDPAGVIRIAEQLVVRDASIVEIRRVYDAVALRRLLPQLHG